MKPEDIQKEIYPPDARIQCRWLRVKQVLDAYPVRTTTLYRLMNERKIRSFVLKDRAGAIQGIRLIDRDSLDLYFETEARRAEEEDKNPPVG